MPEEPAVAPPDPAEALPVCPYCLQDPAVMSARGPLRLGTAQVLVVFCGNPECRKVWGPLLLGVEQPRIVQASPGLLQ